MSQINVTTIRNRTGGPPSLDQGVVVGSAATFSSTVSIAGTLTYEDVTNIDSVGIITAQSYVSIADSIVHTGDINTSLRFPAADTFTVETSGSERLRITSAGLMGLGTSSPEDLLHLQNGSSGASSVASAQLVLESSGSNNWIHFKNPNTQNAGLIWSDASATERAYIYYVVNVYKSL